MVLYKAFVFNFLKHWYDHKNEFPELKSANEYYRFALNFVKNPPDGTLIEVRATGDKLLYHPATNTFASINKDGFIKTVFRPKDGILYWNKVKPKKTNNK